MSQEVRANIYIGVKGLETRLGRNRVGTGWKQDYNGARTGAGDKTGSLQNQKLRL